MVTLEQIQKLESKVFKAVEFIKALKEENSILKSDIESVTEKNEELEQIISDYRNKYVEIEEGILKALKKLEDIENLSSDASVGDIISDTTKAEDNSINSDTVDNNTNVVIQPEQKIEPEKQDFAEKIQTKNTDEEGTPQDNTEEKPSHLGFF